MLPRSAITLFCDDIREEKTGMDTLIGVYPDNINVPNFPFAFPRFSIYTRINIDVTDSPGEITVRLSQPNEEDFLLTTLDRSSISTGQSDANKQGSPMVGLVTKAIASPFLVTAPGQIRVCILIEGQEYVGGTLNIGQAP